MYLMIETYPATGKIFFFFLSFQAETTHENSKPKGKSLNTTSYKQNIHRHIFQDFYQTFGLQIQNN